MNLDFGKQIRVLREQQGISLNKMAKNIGVSAGYLSNLESGKTENIALTVLNTLSTELGVSICPMCNQMVSESQGSDDIELLLRVERIYRVMLLMIKEDPETLSSYLNLLEHGMVIPESKTWKGNH